MGQAWAALTQWIAVTCSVTVTLTLQAFAGRNRGGVILKVDFHGEENGFILQFEWLVDIYFICGLVNHVDKDCFSPTIVGSAPNLWTGCAIGGPLSWCPAHRKETTPSPTAIEEMAIKPQVHAVNAQGVVSEEAPLVVDASSTLVSVALTIVSATAVWL